MISAIDTSILLDIARPNPDFVDNAVDLVEQAGQDGPLVVCPVVHAELSAQFPSMETLDQYLARLEIRLDPFQSLSTWKAGQAWLSYRRAGGTRDRIISDFLIGAHGTTQAGRLLTRDRGFYRKYFDTLVVVESPGDL
jgi:predicted nucleic acid-binding protein